MYPQPAKRTRRSSGKTGGGPSVQPRSGPRYYHSPDGTTPSKAIRKR